MPDTYTREQIDEAKLWLTTNDTGDSYDQKRRIGFEAIILSALDTAERERDRLKDDLADALDCKRGEGPTALSMIIAERDQATELAKQLAKKAAKVEGRAKLLEAQVAELIKAGNSVIHIQEKRGDGEYDGYSRYLRAVKKWDALTTQVEK